MDDPFDDPCCRFVDDDTFSLQSKVGFHINLGPELSCIIWTCLVLTPAMSLRLTKVSITIETMKA